VHIQTSGADTVLTLTDSAPAALTLTSKTLAEAKVLVEAVAGWTMTIAEELTGAESAEFLFRLVSARTVKTGGSEVEASTYFCMGGGLEIQYTGTAYEHVWLRRRDYGSLEIFGDGLRLASLDLTSAANNTLAELRTVISAISDFTCRLCDNDVASGGLTYLLGDELSTNLVENRYVEIRTRRGYLEGGLSGWYIVERQFVKAKEVAAANGVTLRDFAQSGGEIYPWTLHGHDSYGFHRIETFAKSYAPKATHTNAPVNWMPHKNTDLRDSGSDPYSRAAIIAMIDALCASPGWCQNMLVHSVKPDGTGVAQYPALADVTDDMDMYADDWFALLAHIQAKVDAGELEVWTHADMSRYRRLKAPPRNLVYNPKFKNAGGSLVLASTDFGRLVPGWAVIANSSHASACSITDGVFSITSTNTSLTNVIQTELELERGATYEIGCTVEVIDGHATSSNSLFGLMLQGAAGNFASTRERPVLTFRTGSGAAVASVTRRIQQAKWTVTIPEYPGGTPAKVVGNATLTTLDLTTNKNIRLTIDGKAALDNIDCSAGAASVAAVTPQEIANAINAALLASATYGPEYKNVASVYGGKIVLTSPYVGHPFDSQEGYTVVPSAATSNSAFTSIFGNNVFVGFGAHNVMPAAGIGHFNLIFSTASGTFKISNPYCCKVHRTI
jgi:hypothetical protein